MVKDQEDQKPFCKFCKKRFTSARILENHIKINHCSKNSCENDSLNQFDCSGHCLRKSSEKSLKYPSFSTCEASGKRFDSSRYSVGHPETMKNNLIQCEECAEGFRSENSLPNHSMSRHLVNPRVSDEEISISGLSPVRRKRSRTIRYKKVTSTLFYPLIESFSVTEFGQEELEVAESLIMLSRGLLDCFDGSNVAGDFSDINPETSEFGSSKRLRGNLDSHAKYSAECLRNKKTHESREFDNWFLSKDRQEKLCLGFCMHDRCLKMEKPKENLKSGTSSDFLDDLNDPKKKESDYFDHGYMQGSINGTYQETFSAFDSDFCCKTDKPKENLDSGHSSDSPDYLRFKKMHQNNKFDHGFLHNYQKILDLGIGADGTYQEVEQIREDRFEISELLSANSESEMLKTEAHKKGEHRCRTCDKVFASHQALGGHQTLHRTRKKKHRETLELGTVSVNKSDCKTTKLEDELGSMDPNCRICTITRVGQIETKQEVFRLGDAIDLNFPALIAEEADGDDRV